MEAFAWPGVVLILGLICIVVFRQQVGRFLDRTQSVGGKSGLQAYDAQQATIKPDALATFHEGYHSPLMLEIENLIDDDIKKRGLTNVSDANKALRKSLASTLVQLQFEKTHNIIWMSQLDALIFLNGRAPQYTPEVDLQEFYDQASAKFSKLYENRSFQDWLRFLTGQTLVLEAKEGVLITVRGREFLKWRVDEGRSGPYYG